jgi:hypothetical protein
VGPRAGGRFGGEKNSQPLPGLELPIIQSVAQRYATELYRLLKVVKEEENKIHLKIRNLFLV